ncbi:MAG: nucleotidyltransferase family protein [Armatimonadetes bacterium]|nr:nucleotidyltransferase family protein [Armatimonadota bacterium]
MTGLNQIREIISTQRDFLSKKYHISQIGCFGSYATGNETPKSDIDLLVKFSEPIGWEFIELKDFFEKLFNRKVDLITEPALKASLRDAILKEMVLI